MNDYINRADALEACHPVMPTDGAGTIGLTYEDIKNIPAADVREDRRAEWIESGTRTYGRSRTCCSRCGAFALYEFINVGIFGELDPFAHNDIKDKICPFERQHLPQTVPHRPLRPAMCPGEIHTMEELHEVMTA